MRPLSTRNSLSSRHRGVILMSFESRVSSNSVTLLGEKYEIKASVWVVDFSRYKCSNCGNVTRFDVLRTVKTRSFYHYSIGGELNIDSEEVLEDVVHEVTCRWCNSAKTVVEVASDSIVE